MVLNDNNNLSYFRDQIQKTLSIPGVKLGIYGAP